MNLKWLCNYNNINAIYFNSLDIRLFKQFTLFIHQKYFSFFFYLLTWWIIYEGQK